MIFDKMKNSKMVVFVVGLLPESFLGSMSFSIGGWRKKRKKKKKEVKAAPSQSVGPTKSKIFWVIKVGNSAKHATLGSCGISVISDEL